MAKIGRKPKYRPEMCEIAKQSLADGYSKEATAGILGISKPTLYVWIDGKKDFKDAIEAGEALSQRWWEDKGREACVDGEFNATVWRLNMQNRFGFKEQSEQKIVGTVDHKHTVEHISETDAWIAEVIGDGAETEDQTPSTH